MRRFFNLFLISGLILAITATSKPSSPVNAQSTTVRPESVRKSNGDVVVTSQLLAPSDCAIAAGSKLICGIGEGKPQVKMDLGSLGASSRTWRDHSIAAPWGPYDTSCVVDQNGSASCWGKNDLAAIGDNTTSDAAIPKSVTTSGALAGVSLKRISTNGYGTCAVSTIGDLYCWGETGSGNVYDRFYTGTPSSTRLIPPTAVSDPALTAFNWTDISVLDDWTTCAVAETNEVRCFGASIRTFDSSAVPNNESLIQIETYPGLVEPYICVRSNVGNVYCNGAFQFQTVTGNTDDLIFAKVSGITQSANIIMGVEQACSSSSTGIIHCWGSGLSASVGLGVIGYPLVQINTGSDGVTAPLYVSSFREGYATTYSDVLTFYVSDSSGTIRKKNYIGGQAQSWSDISLRAPFAQSISVTTEAGSTRGVLCLKTAFNYSANSFPASQSVIIRDDWGNTFDLAGESSYCSRAIRTGTNYTAIGTTANAFGSSSTSAAVTTWNLAWKGRHFRYNTAYKLTAIFRVDSKGKKKWRASGNCRITGNTIRTGSPTQGRTCRLVLSTKKKGAFQATRNTYTLSIG